MSFGKSFFSSLFLLLIEGGQEPPFEQMVDDEVFSDKSKFRKNSSLIRENQREIFKQVIIEACFSRVRL